MTGPVRRTSGPSRDERGVSHIQPMMTKSGTTSALICYKLPVNDQFVMQQNIVTIELPILIPMVSSILP